jgi:ComF family protein
MIHIVKLMRTLFISFVDLLYPPTCALCQARLTIDEQTLCDPCRREVLTEDTWRCERCGATGSGERPRDGAPCRWCPPAGSAWRGVLAATRYHTAGAECVHRFKYDRRMEVGRAMADLMVARLAEPLLALEERIKWVVPVPLHWTRRTVRGFNQSRVLAERLSQAIDLPLIEALRRTRRTKMQTRVPKEKRAENVRGAFALSFGVDRPVPGVLLVDDVVTTGHTIQECARVLLAGGAPQVWVAAFARA